MLKENIVDSLQAMLDAAELRDPETKEHLDRISFLSGALTEELRKKQLFTHLISPDFLEDIILEILVCH